MEYSSGITSFVYIGAFALRLLNAIDFSSVAYFSVALAPNCDANSILQENQYRLLIETLVRFLLLTCLHLGFIDKTKRHFRVG